MSGEPQSSVGSGASVENGASVEIRPVHDKASRDDFLDVPHTVYRGDPNWVPPLRMIEAERLNPRKHAFYEYGEGQFWVAYRDKKPVGRIGALVNRRHIERHRDGVGHFTMLEAIDDPDVFAALIDTAASWLREKGLTRMLGPANLTINEEFGLLIDGFDTPPFVLMVHGRPYYAGHLEACGLVKAKDLYAFFGPIASKPEDRYLKKLQQLAVRQKVTLRTSSTWSMLGDLKRLFALFNRGWENNWGAVPMTAREIGHAVLNLRFLTVPKLVAIAERDGRMIAAIVLFPNLNESIADIGGRLLPFNWIKVFWRYCVVHPNSARMIIAGVDPDIQRTPLGGALPLLLLTQLREAQRKYGTDHMEASWILEDNTAIIAYCERAGFDRYKTYRVYEKPL